MQHFEFFIECGNRNGSNTVFQDKKGDAENLKQSKQI
jgi:hypothetical protein